MENSTLNWLELVGRIGRYRKVGYLADAIGRMACDLYIESHAKAPDEIVLDLPVYPCSLRDIARLGPHPRDVPPQG